MGRIRVGSNSYLSTEYLAKKKLDEAIAENPRMAQGNIEKAWKAVNNKPVKKAAAKKTAGKKTDEAKGE